MKPLGRINTVWNHRLAYATGLLATDGCLSKDGRHISLTTKDKEQAENFRKCLSLAVKIGLKGRGYTKEKNYYHIQFGDVLFYRFLKSIGLTSAKSKTISSLTIPNRFYFDFLRGVFDGDGYTYSYWDHRWKNSFMFYTGFTSASLHFLKWIQETLQRELNVKGYMTSYRNWYQLKYAKGESLLLLRKIYSNKQGFYLSRKKLKIVKALAIVNKRL